MTRQGATWITRENTTLAKLKGLVERLEEVHAGDDTVVTIAIVDAGQSIHLSDGQVFSEINLPAAGTLIPPS